MFIENTSGSDKGTTGNDQIEVNPHDLPEEELIEAGKAGDDEDQNDKPVDSEETDTSDKSTTSDQEIDKKDDATTSNDDKTTDGAASGKDADTTDDKGDDEEKGDPLKDTQTAFHKKATQLAEAKKEIADLRKKVRELEEPEKPGNYDLSEEELEELRLDDPDEYIRITLAKNKYDADKGTYDQKVQDADAEEAQIVQDLAMQTSIDSIAVFAKDFLKIDGGLPGEPWSNQPKEIRDFYNSDKFQKVISFVEADPKRWYESDGSISQKTLEMVYKHLHFDNLTGLERVNGRREAVSSMRDAASGGSPLDRTAKEESGAGRGGGRSSEKLTQAEINDMGPKELASHIAEFGIDDEEEDG